MKYSFRNDYSSIAHKKVLERLIECQNEQNIGYGEDTHTLNAKKIIQDKIKNKSEVFFLVGGTQTNMTIIDHILKPYEAVIAASTGHINVHETGAIEGRGHKVLTCNTTDGKLNPSMVLEILNNHTDYHMVKPKMIYISNTTEVGSYYTLNELKALYKCAHDNDLYLFLDGARLASALAISNIDYPDYAKYTDVFYIGGTKNGSYLGEAVVINNKNLATEFQYSIKHNGAMLAKGFVASIPFEVLMEGNLYKEIGSLENECANYITQELKSLGYKFYSDSKTNQIFVIVTNDLANYIKKEYDFEIWNKINDNEVAIRLVTSFTTTLEISKEFIEYVKQYKK
jgi:threonine aldolase